MGKSATPAQSAAPTIAQVDVFDRLADAEPFWRGMETAEHRLSPFQRFDFVSAWQAHVGRADDMRPFVVVASDARRQPLMLLPLAIKSENGVKVASFFGGKHSTFNMPLLHRDFALHAGARDVDTLLDLLRCRRDRPDVLALERQPSRWRDVANPLALLPMQASVNPCPVLTLAPGAPPTDWVSASSRSRLRGKERKLEALPGYRYLIADTEADITRLLHAFFVIKPQRMAAAGLPNVFADKSIRDFIVAASLARGPNGRRLIEIHALQCDAEVIAIFAGVADEHRFSMMFNTYTVSANAKYSPGLILLRHIIDTYAGRGCTVIDLGVGSDDYKRQFCKDDEALFDSFLPLTVKGSLAALGLSSLTHAKYYVKNTPLLARVLHALRGTVQG